MNSRRGLTDSYVVRRAIHKTQTAGEEVVVKEEIARKPIVVRAVFQRRPAKAVTGEEGLTVMRLQPTKGEAARRQAKGARGEARLLIPREAGCVASSAAGPPNIEDREASELLCSLRR
jgi:hypothetical protein